MSELTITNDDERRDAVMRAAKAYDKLYEEIHNKDAEIARLSIDLESVRGQIVQLELCIAQERNRTEMLQNERDDAILEKSTLHVMFHNLKAQLDAFVLPLPELPAATRKKTNGKKEEATNDDTKPN